MERVRRIVRNKRARAVAAIVVILLTLGIFAFYLTTRPETLKALIDLDLATLVLLTLAYSLTVIVNAFVLWASLKLIRKPVHYLENVALTGYSSIINFFGPLQSGPGFRAAYLKTKHDVSLKRFLYVTLIFYGFFALLNGLVIIFAAGSLLQPALILPVATAIVIVIAVSYVFRARLRFMKDYLKQVRLTDMYFWAIGMGALLLSLATALVYSIELRHVDASINIGQTLAYTAAANLALFVSLTPGAIGFRESFLLLSQQLHGISSDTIVAASIIDRAFYVVFLLVLFVLLLLFGARSRFK